MHHVEVHLQIFLNAWQWECCGDAFRVGSTVQWELERSDGIDAYLASMLGSQWSGSVGYAEDHHDLMREGLDVSGVVRSIGVLTVDHDQIGSWLVAVPGSGILEQVDAMDPWATGLAHDPFGRALDGWIVDLELTGEPSPRQLPPVSEPGD